VAQPALSWTAGLESISLSLAPSVRSPDFSDAVTQVTAQQRTQGDPIGVPDGVLLVYRIEPV